jgi:hypothetical protein
MKCEKCNSSMVYVDAETDRAWCRSCGYIEGVDYRTEPPIRAICHDNGKVDVWMNDDTYVKFQEHAEEARISIEAYLTQIIEDGMKKELKKNG